MSECVSVSLLSFSPYPVWLFLSRFFRFFFSLVRSVFLCFVLEPHQEKCRRCSRCAPARRAQTKPMTCLLCGQRIQHVGYFFIFFFFSSLDKSRTLCFCATMACVCAALCRCVTPSPSLTFKSRLCSRCASSSLPQLTELGTHATALRLLRANVSSRTSPEGALPSV